MLESQQVRTVSGRIISTPKLKPGSVGERGNSNKTLNKWLLDQAIQEATYRRDTGRLEQFQHENPKNMPHALITDINYYLFDDGYPEWQCNSEARYGGF